MLLLLPALYVWAVRVVVVSVARMFLAMWRVCVCSAICVVSVVCSDIGVALCVWCYVWCVLAFSVCGCCGVTVARARRVVIVECVW